MVPFYKKERQTGFSLWHVSIVMNTQFWQTTTFQTHLYWKDQIIRSRVLFLGPGTSWLGNKTQKNITLNESIIKLPSTKMPVTVMLLKVWPLNITFSCHHLTFLCLQAMDRTSCDIPPTLLSSRWFHFRKERVFTLLFSSCQSPEPQILISHFLWDHTDPCDMFSPLRLAQGQKSHTIQRHCQKPSNSQELGNHQNQPTFEMLWISWTCSGCIMLHRLKLPTGIGTVSCTTVFWENR